MRSDGWSVGRGSAEDQRHSDQQRNQDAGGPDRVAKKADILTPYSALTMNVGLFTPWNRFRGSRVKSMKVPGSDTFLPHSESRKGPPGKPGGLFGNEVL